MTIVGARRGFASDNAATVHPRVLEAIAAANAGHAFGYGHDPYTHEVERRLASALGAPDAAVFFVFNGSGANVLSLRTALRPWEAAIVSANAHLQTDEVGAPEAVAGVKLLVAETENGRVTLDGVRRLVEKPNDEHAVKPGLLSLTQSTELGTLYTLDELRALSELAHAHGLRVHVDGARFANAAAALGVALPELVAAGGVDLLSFGGTKNGLMLGEAVVVFNESLVPGMLHLRKQTLQLASKMRFIAAQFDALIHDDLWLANADSRQRHGPPSVRVCGGHRRGHRHARTRCQCRVRDAAACGPGAVCCRNSTSTSGTTSRARFAGCARGTPRKPTWMNSPALCVRRSPPSPGSRDARPAPSPPRATAPPAPVRQRAAAEHGRRCPASAT